MPASGWDFGLEGADDLQSALSDLSEGMEKEGRWWVGTIVEYAWYLEFGTRFMQPHSFFGPGVERLKNRLRGGDISVGLDLILDPDASVAEELAFELERQVKQVIIDKGLIDTSNLLNSIAAGPSVTAMEMASGSGVASEGDPDALR